jgi:hypothetical protein
MRWVSVKLAWVGRHAHLPYLPRDWPPGRQLTLAVTSTHDFLSLSSYHAHEIQHHHSSSQVWRASERTRQRKRHLRHRVPRQRRYSAAAAGAHVHHTLFTTTRRMPKMSPRWLQISQPREPGHSQSLTRPSARPASRHPHLATTPDPRMSSCPSQVRTL